MASDAARLEELSVPKGTTIKTTNAGSPIIKTEKETTNIPTGVKQTTTNARGNNQKETKTKVTDTSKGKNAENHDLKKQETKPEVGKRNYKYTNRCKANNNKCKR